jgi:hypothetical protein
LRKCDILTETSTDVRGLHVHLETVDIEFDGFSDPKDFALIKRSAQFVKCAVKRDVFALLVRSDSARAVFISLELSNKRRGAEKFEATDAAQLRASRALGW